MLETTTRTDGVTVFRFLQPRLDAANAPAFRDLVARAVDQGDVRIVLDMAGVEFVDSSGLGALVGALKRVGTRGDLALAGLRPPVQKAFKLTRMDRVFQIFPDTDSAMGRLRDS